MELEQPNDASVPAISKRLNEIWFRQKKDNEELSSVTIGYLNSLLVAEDEWEMERNPVLVALDLVRNAYDFQLSKPHCLAATLMHKVREWLLLKDAAFHQRFVSNDVKHAAFQMAMERHPVYLTDVIEGFRLGENPREFLPEIRKLLDRSLYKYAAIATKSLKMEDSFGLDEIVIPCVLQDKLNLVEMYIADRAVLQRELISRLDDLLSSNVSLEDYLGKFQHVPQIRKDKITKPVLEKLLARWTKAYEIPSDVTPNLTSQRACKALRYHLRQYYIEKSLDYTTWSDIIEGDLSHCPKGGRARKAVTGVLLNELCFRHRDLEEAARWYSKCHVPLNGVPGALYNYLLEHPEKQYESDADFEAGSSNQQTEDDHIRDLYSNTDHLLLPFSLDRVHMVDSRDTLANCLDSIRGDGICGIDCEFVSTGLVNTDMVTLIQLATFTDVYLIDVECFRELLSEQEWKYFIRSLFCASSIRKLGFGFSTDMRMLRPTLPFCVEEFSGMDNVVDLLLLVQNICSQDRTFLDGITELTKRPLLQLKPKKQGVTPEEDTVENAVESPMPGSSPTIPATNQPQNNETLSDTTNKAPGLGTRQKFQLGLTDLCHYFLGKPLDKSQQCSNFAKRPLRARQKFYAALDAYCELEIYQKIHEKCSLLGIDLEAACAKSLVSGGQQPKATKRKTAVQKNLEKAEMLEVIQNLCNSSSPVTPGAKRPSDVRLMVDSMLFGLGKHLRRVGVDVQIPSNMDTQQEILQAAADDKRILITMGSSYLKYATHLEPGLVVIVPNQMSSKDQLVWVLKHFEITVGLQDIFSRCMACNSAKFYVVPQSLMEKLWSSVRASVFDGEQLSDPSLTTADWIYYPKKSAALNSTPNQRKGKASTKRASANEVIEDEDVGDGGETKPEQSTDSKHENYKSEILKKLPTTPPSLEKWQEFDPVAWRHDIITASPNFKAVDEDPEEELPGIQLGKIFDTPVQCLTIPKSVVEKVEEFFICEHCGKVYWEGNHFPRYMKKVDGVVEKPAK